MKQHSRSGKKYFHLTNEECNQLFDLADATLLNAYPFSNKGFSCGLMTEDAKTYAGVSYQSDTKTLTMHAEATALAHAAIHGDKRIVAITGPNCHICKQLIYESSLRSGIDVVVILREQKMVKQIRISTMMPYPWPYSPS